MQEGMTKLLVAAGTAVLVVSAISTLAAAVTGAVQWAGLAAPFSPALPPQSLVVGGLFLGIPVAALGWGMIWFGRWLDQHR
jgi:hypothetical protein